MSKKMAEKLIEYNKSVFLDWWGKNPNYEVDLKRRLKETYISDKIIKE